jgi:hypothetical protein
MATKNDRVQSPFSDFVGGIADFEKDTTPATYAFGRSIDYRTNPRELTLLPKTTKESGSIVTDLPKWGERVVNTSYFYGSTGNIYSKDLLQLQLGQTLEQWLHPTVMEWLTLEKMILSITLQIKLLVDMAQLLEHQLSQMTTLVLKGEFLQILMSFH